MLLHFAQKVIRVRRYRNSFNFLIQIALPLSIIDSYVHSSSFLGAVQSNDRGIQKSVYLYTNEKKIMWKDRKREKMGSTRLPLKNH